MFVPYGHVVMPAFPSLEKGDFAASCWVMPLFMEAMCKAVPATTALAMANFNRPTFVANNTKQNWIDRSVVFEKLMCVMSVPATVVAAPMSAPGADTSVL